LPGGVQRRATRAERRLQHLELQLVPCRLHLQRQLVRVRWARVRLEVLRLGRLLRGSGAVLQRDVLARLPLLKEPFTASADAFDAIERELAALWAK
jgi:hypothetical protein